ncbi:hypothetical protein JL721_9820 [Aureococcus anophagefferens]|nr:hypothetical protein JL721_9820 [Aureococcus anophagefferens]
MGLCGVVLVALGSTLSTIAGRCGTTATDAGTVFLARGFGAVLGGALDVKLFEATAPLGRQRKVVVLAQLFLALVLGLMPGCTSVWVLHVLWGATGLGTATLDTGVQIATRDAQGPHAPAWHVYNTVAFAVAGAVVPLTLLLTENEWGAPEVLFGAICFWLLGGKVDATSYVTAYIQDSGIVADVLAPYAVLTLWLSLIAGRLIGLKGQMTLIDMRSATGPNGSRHLALWLCMGTLGVLFVVAAHTSKVNFWIGLAVYGFGNGPSIGYCYDQRYDLVNRISNSTVEGLVVIMMGLNVGSSLVPYTTSVIWSELGPGTLIWAMLVCVTVPLPLLYVSPWVLERRENALAASVPQPRRKPRRSRSAGSDASGLGGAGSSRDSLADFSEDDPQTGDDDDDDLPVYI